MTLLVLVVILITWLGWWSIVGYLLLITAVLWMSWVAINFIFSQITRSVDFGIVLFRAGTSNMMAKRQVLKPNETTTSHAQNAQQLAKILSAAGIPEIEQSMPPLQVTQLSTSSQMNTLVRSIRDQAFGGPQYRKQQERSVRLIINSLILAGFGHKHLALGTRVKKDSYLDRLRLNRRHIEKITEVLIDQGLCKETRGGFRHETYPELSKSTQYFPTDKLLSAYCTILYDTVGDFDQYEAYRFENNVEPWEPDWHQKKERLQFYNEFMRSSSWAFKAPSVRRLGAVPFTSGRIYTPYQNITNRRIEIRSRTLLNGEKLTEVDFSANHLTMLSKLFGEQLPEDPYDAVSTFAGIDRSTVKRILVPLLGAKSKSSLGQIKWSLRNCASEELVHKVIDGFDEIMPWLTDRNLLLNNVGTRLQYLEGEIALKMFAWAASEGIPIINVHDAYACLPNRGADVFNAMHSYRDQVIDECKQLFV